MQSLCMTRVVCVCVCAGARARAWVCLCVCTRAFARVDSIIIHGGPTVKSAADLDASDIRISRETDIGNPKNRRVRLPGGGGGCKSRDQSKNSRRPVKYRIFTNKSPRQRPFERPRLAGDKRPCSLPPSLSLSYSGPNFTSYYKG